MNLKSIVTAFIFAVVPAHLQAQQPLPNASKPTKADAQRVIQIIGGDKTKRERYCDLAKLDDQIEQANSAKDTKKAEKLSQTLFEKSRALGPEYIALMAGLDELVLLSKEGQEIITVLGALDKLCAKK